MCDYLRYAQPAMEWINGLPIGNGSIGAMFYGRPGEEVLTLNHSRLWRNYKLHEINTAKIVPKIRELCLQGDGAKAEKLLRETAFDSRNRISPYQVFGELKIHMNDADTPENYERSLDISRGIVNLSYTAKGVMYSYESFVSHEHDAIFLKITSDKPGAISCGVSLSRIDDPECEITTKHVNNCMIMEGRFVEGLSFAGLLNVDMTGGNLKHENDMLIIAGADAVLFKVLLSTGCVNPADDCIKRNAAPGDDYDLIKGKHIADHYGMFSRASLAIGNNEDVLTDELFRDIAKTEEPDNRLYPYIFQMARYLMISGSRPGSLPMNLQGIWNDKISPEWDCSMVTDMNIQMHYWLALPANLFECKQPVFDWIFSNIDRLKENSQNIFGCRGVYIPQWTDFKFTATAGGSLMFWSGAAAWMAQHFYEYWKFSKDDDFLMGYAYPYMKECAAFYEDFIVKDSDGYYIVCPACSPENMTVDESWLVNTPTMDITLIHELMGNLIEISEEFKIDESERQKWIEIDENIAPYPIDENGCLREWVDTIEEMEPYHRHLSHLYGLHPGKLFTQEKNPAMYAAAVKALEKRRSGGFGDSASWSHSWYACCFVRIGDGDTALKCINDLIRSCMLENFLTTHTDFRDTGLTGTWDEHKYTHQKVFQLDAIMGAASAITEMMIQSDDTGIKILPALPSSWPDGKVRGLRAYAGFEVDIEWKNCIPSKIVVKSHNGGTCRLKVCRPHSDAIFVTFETEINGIYNIYQGGTCIE